MEHATQKLNSESYLDLSEKEGFLEQNWREIKESFSNLFQERTLLNSFFITDDYKKEVSDKMEMEHANEEQEVKEKAKDPRDFNIMKECNLDFEALRTPGL